MAVDPTGGFLFVTNYNNCSFSAYTIDAGGAIAAISDGYYYLGFSFPNCIAVVKTTSKE